MVPIRARADVDLGIVGGGIAGGALAAVMAASSRAPPSPIKFGENAAAGAWALTDDELAEVGQLESGSRKSPTWPAAWPPLPFEAFSDHLDGRSGRLKFKIT